MSFFDEAFRRQNDSRSKEEAIANAVYTCRLCALMGIRKSCKGCFFSSSENIINKFIDRTTIDTKAKSNRKPRKYRMASAHRVTGLLGIYKIIGVKNFKNLMHSYGVPDEFDTVAGILEYAGSTVRKYGRMTIELEVIRDFNAGKTKYR